MYEYDSTISKIDKLLKERQYLYENMLYDDTNIQRIDLKLKKFQPPTIVDLIYKEEEEETDNWLIRDLIPIEGYGEIYGESGSFKSFIILDMLFCIVNGLNFHNLTVQEGNVFYVPAEGRKGIVKRILALEEKYDVEIKFNKFFVPESIDLYDEESMQNLSYQLKVIGNVRIIVFDTLRRNSPTANEDSASDWNLIMHHLDKYVKPYCDVVCWVHHTNKSGKSSGTTARYASADFSYILKRQGSTNAVTLKCDKMKDDNVEGKLMKFDLIPFSNSLAPVLINDNLSDKAKQVLHENNLTNSFTEDQLREAVNKTFSDKSSANQRQIYHRIKKEDGIKKRLEM